MNVQDLTVPTTLWPDQRNRWLGAKTKQSQQINPQDVPPQDAVVAASCAGHERPTWPRVFPGL